MPHNPHANFSPTLEGYSGQTPFRYWCQMALPLTYDDSLSYYELLNKVVSYVNNTIEDVANVETNVGRLSDAYNQLQNYVNDYFDNINIEQELTTVLDRMALDGTLDELLAPIVALQLPDVVEEQIDDVVSEQIGGAVSQQIGDAVEEQLPNVVPNSVSNWLAENVDPVGSAVLVDKTLTIANAAADAETTGDKIKNGITSLPITNLLFPNDKTGLTNNGASATNKRQINIRHNCIELIPTASNPTGSTYQTYLISGENPKYLTTQIAGAISALTAEDFTPITQFDHSQLVDLFVIISKISNATLFAQDCKITFITYNSNTEEKSYTDQYTVWNGAGIGGTLMYNLCEILPAIITNKNLAILLETRHAYVNSEIKFIFFQAANTTILKAASPADNGNVFLADRYLPVYWRTEINNKISTIQTNEMNGNYSSPSILFVTDTHWNDNKKYSPRIAKNIITKTNINYFINGGDFIKDYNAEGKAAAASELWEGLKAFETVGLPMLTLYGNHDRNRDGNPNKDNDAYVLTRKEHMNIIYKSFINVPGLTFKSYTDNPWDVIYWEDMYYRYVLTYWYLQNTSRLPSDFVADIFNTDKDVIIFNHGIYGTLSENLSEDEVQGAYILTDCEPYKNKIKCFVQGHSHQDGLRWAYDGSVPIIILDCDTFRSSKSIAGTASEQCLSVLTFNENNIKITRIGRGLNMEITNNTEPFIVKYTDYVPSIVNCT